MREIVLDTETTGLNVNEGHRIVEIGCVELVNHVPTGGHYHTYVNPERSMPEAAREIHGLDDTFLSGQPVFADIVEAFLTFLEDAPLVVHNAAFDLGFLDAELKRVNQIPLSGGRAIDTLEVARRKYPGRPNSLDALCHRFNIDTSAREKHSALVDARLLADVYLELVGGRQPGLSLNGIGRTAVWMPDRKTEASRRIPRPRPLPPRLTDEERKAHAAFVESLAQDADGVIPLWMRGKQD